MKIVHYPHPTLRYKSKLVKRVDGELVDAIREMFGLMYEANGVGLAANQVNLPLRLFVVNLSANPKEGDEMVFINPVVSRPRAPGEAEEGCLSLPGLYGPVIRPQKVHLTAFNLRGEEVDTDLDGMLARVVQHELDHLDGVLFPDRMSDTQRLTIRPELDEFETEFMSLQRTGGIAADEELTAELADWEQKYC